MRERRSLKFLVNNICNYRCSFCHNEFQGDFVKGTRLEASNYSPEVVRATVERLNAAFDIENIKFSGGEPTMTLGRLFMIASICDEVAPKNKVLISNFWKIDAKDIERLAAHRFTQVRVNICSFEKSVWEEVVRKPFSILEDVIENCRLAQNAGIKVMINRVIAAPISADEIARDVDHLKQRGIFAQINYIVDDYIGDDEEIFRRNKKSLLSAFDGGRIVQEHPRYFSMSMNGFDVCVLRCTEWGENNDVASADIYLQSPGVEKDEFVRGKAYVA